MLPLEHANNVKSKIYICGVVVYTHSLTALLTRRVYIGMGMNASFAHNMVMKVTHQRVLVMGIRVMMTVLQRMIWNRRWACTGRESTG